ncbi:hypothetical protein [Maridesulfovibrio ferrireducens]|uniref:hypothetical protein n=1 Tax=Maridesulfovibrio ferrireducens TaxID=246191 RepID=UPI001A1F16A3|nr:hypothetical protein [Maridesulfovibrio ferrireducens]MBI9110098.1 hypothetical protein [Maridesulfovibrio ferrireducens]
MNNISELHRLESKQKALKLLDKLVSTPRKTAKQSKNIPFFDFPDGPKYYHFVRGWEFAVPEWFHNRLGCKVGKETSRLQYEELTEKEKIMCKPDEKGMTSIARDIEFQSSAFCFKKNDVIKKTPAAYVLVDSEGNKNPIRIEGWPDKSTTYILVKDANEAVPAYTTIDRETKEKIHHKRYSGKVTFEFSQNDEIELKTLSQDEFIKFLIEG